jgi:hypothetical protein
MSQTTNQLEKIALDMAFHAFPYWIELTWTNQQYDLVTLKIDINTNNIGKRLHNYGKIHHFSWENPRTKWPFSIAILT